MRPSCFFVSFVVKLFYPAQNLLRLYPSLNPDYNSLVPRLTLITLGSPRVELDGAPLTVFDKVQALLLYLAIESHAPHRRETLAGMFWPEQPDKAARNNLRVSLFRLRHAIGDTDSLTPFLHVTNTTVTFNPHSACDLDLARFQALITEADPRPIAEGISLYRGDFLQGFYVADSAAFEAWAQILRQQLHTQALDTLARLAEHHLAQHAYSAAQRYALRQLELEPWREEAHRQLMRALALSGQRNTALTQYQACRRSLASNLNIEPGDETTRLFNRIRAGDLDLPVGPAAPGNVALTRAVTVESPSAVPVPFVGREPERARLAEQLTAPDTRLLTLTGPAGIGKTRLAQQIAAELAAHFTHGAHFVPLATLTAPDFIPTAIAQALAVPLADWLARLAGQETLLVLDHFDHLGPKAEFYLEEILRHAPRVKLLVTARARLHLSGQRSLKVDGLQTPPAPRRRAAANYDGLESYSAVRLFLEHATRAQPGFALSAVSRPAIARLCQLLDGVPLALELAAAWVSEFNPETIAHEIDAALNAPLTQFNYAQPRALTAVFEFAWKHLTETERRAYRQLSVFVGDFSAEAAPVVAHCDSLTLSTLASKALLAVSTANRYALPTALLSLAADKLTQAPEEIEPARDRHCDYYISLLLGEYAEAEQLLSEALAICQSADDKKGAASALSQLGEAAFGRGRYPEAQRLLDESLQLSRPLLAHWLTAHALYYLHETALALADYAAAQVHLHAALLAAEEARAARLAFSILLGAAKLLIQQSRPEPATELLALVARSPVSAARDRMRAEQLLAELPSEFHPAENYLSLSEALAWVKTHLAPIES